VRVNRRRGQIAADCDSKTLKALKKTVSGWGHDRRRWWPHPAADSSMRLNAVVLFVQVAPSGADLHVSMAVVVLRSDSSAL